MKKQKICIIGDGLAGLTTALTLKNLDLDIDVYYKKIKSVSNADKRITAVSESNYKFIYEKNILKKNKFFGHVKKYHCITNIKITYKIFLILTIREKI